MFGASKSGQISKGLPDPQFNYVTALLHGDGTNGAQNNTFLDSSTNNATITRTGTPTQGSFSPYGSLWSNYFGGASDYITIQASATTDLGSSSFTHEFWYYCASTTQRQGFLCSASDYWFGIDYQTGGIGLGLWASSTGTSWNLINADSGGNGITNATPTLGNWNHIAVSRSGTSWAMWLNGTRILSLTVSGSVVSRSSEVKRIGTWAAAYNFPLYGYLSNIRLVIGSAVYAPSSATITVPTTALTAITNTQVLTAQSNRFFDASTNNLTIGLSGTPSVQRFNPFLPTSSQAYSTSVYGGSGNFNGTTDYLTGTLSTAIGSGNFTIECWVYLRALVDYEDFFSITRGAFGFNIGTDSTGVLTIYNNVGGRLLTSSTGALKVNQWTHVAYVRSGTTLTGFINGVSFGTVTNATVFSATAFAIGDLDSSNSEYLNGYLTDTRLTNTVVYSGNFTPSTAPLSAVSGTLLLVNYQNGAIYDNAMMNDLITVGSAQISTSVKKYGTGSLSFNGTTDYLILPKNNAILDPLSGNFTYECWLYLSGTQRGSIIGSGSGSNVFTIWVDYNSTSSGKLGMWASSNGTSWNMINSDTGGNGIGTTVLSTGVWYHVAYTRSGNTFRLFLNGNLEVSVTVSGTIASSNSSWEIGRQGTYGYYLNGYIDDFRITQGYARYTSNFTPPTTALPNYGM